MQRILFLVFIIGVSTVSFNSWGQILTFEFAGSAGNESTINSNFNNANLNSSVISRGVGLSASANADRFNATNWAITSITNAITGNKYMEFTVSPKVGYRFLVTSIVVRLQRSATGLSSIALRNSLDGYTTNLDAIKTVVDNTNTQTFIFSFTQAISASSVTYRLYGYSESTAGSGGPGDYSGDDIVVNGDVFSTSSVSLPTDYFQSKQNGDWASTSTWQSSPTGLAGTWVSADLVPGSAASDVYISHTVYVTSKVSLNKTKVAASLLLLNGPINTTINTILFNGIYNGIMNLNDGVSDELTILNGGKLQAVSTSADYATAILYNTNGNINVNTGGTITIGDGTGLHSASDYWRFAATLNTDAAPSPVTWNSYSIFEWNTTNISGLKTASATYFPSVNASTIPILKLAVTMSGTWGAGSATVINGLLEIDAPNTLVGAGDKTIRDGIIGTSTLTLSATSTNLISSSTAVLDGTSLTLKLNQPLTINGIAVPSGANIKIDDASAANILLNNKNFNVDAGGTFDIGTTTQLSGSGTVTVSGTFKTANANGFSGVLASVPTASVTINSGSVIEYNATGDQTFTTRNDYSGIAISGANTSKKIMNGNATASGTLILNNGVLVTGDHLFTWNYSPGALTQPSIYTDSYICTCDATGKETTLKDGTAGFRINNVGGSSDVFFPVGTDYVSPNRMAINMNGSTTDNFTVVVGKGDIGNTPWPKVNRIWYVKEETPDESTANMKLFFTEKDASQFLSGQDEIETGFDFTKIALLQKGYTDPNFYNASSSSDIQSFPNGAYDNQEVYALYTFGVSPDVNGNKLGIDTFTRFSVVGADLSNIILPVSITGLKAYQKGNAIQVDWTALNESAVDHYEVEKSVNAVSFASISTLKARNNGNARNDYFITDNNPANGKNFYRIKIFDKNGHVTTTEYVVVNIANGKVSVTVLPNPVRNKTLVTSFNNVPAGNYQLVLYSSSGQKMYQQIIEHAGGSLSQTIKLPAAISHGVYILKVFNNSINFAEKVLIE